MESGDARESSETRCGVAGDGSVGSVLITATFHKNQCGNGDQRLGEDSIADGIGGGESGNRCDAVWLCTPMTWLMGERFSR